MTAGTMFLSNHKSLPGWNMKVLSVCLVAILLVACDKANEAGNYMVEKYELADQYPDTQSGVSEAVGIFMSKLVIHSGGPAPLMFALEDGRRLLAEVRPYGKYSLEIIPMSIYCNDIESKVNGAIGNVFLDTRAIPEKVVFQIYSNEKFTICDSE
ncbi:hypothetical protein [Microbulbifer epialgicus]|uniref:Lipoprotein n=1 Tax=Microbulbifer epialgicus TaxID=393907 RepID=A0ABV4NTP3_9GAMM